MAENKFSNEETTARCVPMAKLQSVIGESFIPVLQTMMTWSEANLCLDWKNPYEKE